MNAVTSRSRVKGATLLAAIIASGLFLRGFGPWFGLPFLVVKYGGSILWGMMVYVGLTVIAPARGAAFLAAAVMIAAAVEFSRLYHTPWLDAFRLTTAGALLLGRVFSLWNLAAYGAGILLGCIAHYVTRAR